MVLLLSLQSISLKSQQYPVRLIPSIFQPYSLKLGDYATSTEPKLQLQLLMTDLMEPQHQTGLKFSLESGLNAVPLAVSNDFVVGFSPFTLYPGSQLTLSNIDVRALFELQNLSGINSVQYAQALPDGVYQFCFQAYDYYTKNNLSQKSCATVYLVQYDPPQLNLPQNGEKLQAITPYSGGSGIVFQWMPRQIAPNTKYIFTLKELWDLGQSPISGFLSSRVLWQEESYSPTLFYGLDKPQLMPGKRYAWQVQAKSGNPVLGANPTEDNGIYKNNGLTEIFYFDYVEDCTLPTLLMAKNAGRGRVELSWNLSGKPSGLYQVQYRRKGSNTQWQTVQSYQPRYIITGLEDQTEYEYRVGNACGQLATAGNNDNPITDSHSAGNAYAYSGIQYFTTDSKDLQNNNFQCGVMPAVDISNKEPLRQSLVANDIFTAGDFPVTIIEAQGSNGIFTGTGFIQVPYLADTKIKVAFQNITINSDKKLISGTVETEYDPNESAVHFASTGLGELFGDAGIKDITLDYNVSNVQFIATPPPGKIIIIGDNGKENNDDTGSGTGSTQELPAGRDYTIVDKNGNVWSVDEDGNITSGGTLADGGKSTSENTDGVDANGSANAITAKGIKVDFENASNSKYAFDKPKKLISNDYKEISGYIIPFKAVENKETEPFIAKISITDDSVKADSLIFKTSKGVAIEAKKIDGTNDFELTLKGTYSYDKEEIQAVIKQNGKYQIAGVFNLVHISPKTIKLNLVPTTGVKIADETIAQIKNIYSKVAINLDITTKPEFDIKDFLVNNKLPTEEEFGDLSTYSQAQNNIISKYMADNKEVGLEYYIFVTDKPSSSGQGGYMRLNGQFGFVFNQSARTIAHELAHGALKLEHPFKQFKNLTKGETSSIMDYAGGIDFIFPEWKQINDPKLKLYAFQEQKEGEFNGGYVISPDYQIFTIGVENTIVDKTNYTLNSKAANDGTLPGFKLGGIDYWWDYNTNKYINSDTDKKGYEIKNVNSNLASIKDSNLFLFFDKDKDCGKGTYVYIKISDLIESKKGIDTLIASYSNASYGTLSVVELGKKEFVACNSENLTWKKKSENTHSNGTYGNGTSSDFFNRVKQANGNNDADTSKNIIDFSGGFTQEQISKMLQDLNLTSSETGIKGKIIITDEENLQNANEIFNSPKYDEIIILLYIKDANTKEYEIKINAGKGLPQFKNKSFQDILNQITNKKGWFNIDEFWTINFNPLTAIFDGLAWLIGQAEIPEKFYNPEHKEYNPILYHLSLVDTTNISLFITDTALQQFNISGDIPKVYFAAKCGVWNGLVGQIAGLADTAGLLSDLLSGGDRASEIWEGLGKLDVFCTESVGENTCIWSLINKAHQGNKYEVSHQIGKDVSEVLTIAISFAKVGKLAKVSQIADALDPINYIVRGAGKVIKPMAIGTGKSAKFVFKVSKAFVAEGVHFTTLDNKVYTTIIPIPIDLTPNVEKAINKAKELLNTNKNKFDEEVIPRKDKNGNPLQDSNGNAIADINIDGQKVEVILSPNDKLAKESVEEVVVSKKGIQQVKNLLVNSPDWVKSNTELLEKLADKSDEFIKKVDEFYSTTMKKQTPVGFSGGEKLYGGVWFNKYGFPDFEKMGQTLGKKYNFIGANGNYTDDFTRARDWLKKQNGIEEIKDLRNGSPLLVKINGKWEKITWHHHEDGKTLIPVFSEIHEKTKHIGGVKTKELNINNLFEYGEY